VSLEALRAELAAHADCGFDLCAGCAQLVPGDGPAHAAVMLVGEAPGAAEDAEGRPFVGRSGKLLFEALAAAGIARADVYVTNVVKARPPGNRDPKADEVAHHRPWLEAELSLIRPRLVVPIGRHALKHFAPEAKIGDAHGVEVVSEGRTLFPLYHPAAALRSTALRATLFADARTLGDVLAR
jgi:uracil-DNA glycosylase family 4